MKKIAIMLSLLLLAANGFCLENSLLNRETQAQRYQEVTPLKVLFEDMADKFSCNLPPSERQTFKDVLLKHTDFDALSEIMKAALVSHFTADELYALANLVLPQNLWVDFRKWGPEQLPG
jgi:hypothetical protein